MDVVYQAKDLTMAFCLDCHRGTEAVLRPLDKVTDLAWKAPTDAEGLAALLGKKPEELNLKAGGKVSPANAQKIVGEHFKQLRGVRPPDSNCAGCHR
jgi:hypothetical protein